MRSRIVLFAIVLVLSAATVAAAQSVQSGTIVRVDPQSSVVVLDDGRMYRVTPSTVFLIDSRPTAFTVLRSGDRVVIQSGEPVAYREGRYVAVAAAPAVAAPAPVVQAPPTIIAQAPPPAPAPMAVPVGVRQTIYGTVTDVDHDGKIKIKTDRDHFEARVSPDALRQIKKGDNVVIDLTISPPGAASPR
jgi:predicted RecA/RadA family phage recombinase